MNDWQKRRQRRVNLARKKGRHTTAAWTALCASVGFRCVLCWQEGQTLTKDHIVPLAEEDNPRASDAIENLQPMCHRCNSFKWSFCSEDWLAYRRGEASLPGYVLGGKIGREDIPPELLDYGLRTSTKLFAVRLAEYFRITGGEAKRLARNEIDIARPYSKVHPTFEPEPVGETLRRAYLR